MLKKTIMLMILDGWGFREELSYNAIAYANTPQWDEWWQTRPHILLDASGNTVGLPHQQMGNSEVGHMHIGAGRIIPQDLVQIHQSIEQGAFFKHTTIIKTIDDLKKNQGCLHVMGLLSNGGVHSHEDHLFAILRLCHEQHFDHVILHLFLDGRDTSPQYAEESMTRLEHQLQQYPCASIASISGRYYAMDRDQRFERTQSVIDLLLKGKAHLCAASAKEALFHYYEQGIYDEFIPPTQIGGPHLIQPNDAVFFFNFRQDRARQLTKQLLQSIHLSTFLSMTSYGEDLKTIPVFAKSELKNTLGEILAQHHYHQLRIAETEKYPHVTFFFNGGQEALFPYEDRILIPSPKIATYDLKPEMSAGELTHQLMEAIDSNTYDFILCNFANADMVGHTGQFNATVQAIEYLDHCMALIAKKLLDHQGLLLITADHGNAEAMYDEHSGQPHTAHTTDPVPLVYVGNEPWIFNQPHGSLVDIAPTVLTLLGLPIPKEMTGTPLLCQELHTC